MPDDPGFELRLTAAYRRYLDDAPEIDAVELARSIARAHPRGRRGWWNWPAFAQLGRVGWLVILVALLLAVLAAILSVGAFRRLPAPDGLARAGIIAFDTKGGHIVLTGADGSDARDISAPTGGDHLPIWSPDGTHLAFWRATGDFFSIVVTDPDGTIESATLTQAPVPPDTASAYAGGAPGPLAWAPDSRHIAFWMYVDGLPRIHTMSSDGADLHAIGDPRIPAIDPAWSPDGSRIAFAGMGDFFGDQGAAPDSTGLFVMDADGTGVRRIAHVDHALTESDFYAFHEPQWQPGGELIAFQADSDGASMRVLVVRADGTGERDVSLQVGGHISDDAWPAWSPDGTLLAFTRPRTDSASRRSPVVGYQVVVVGADGTEVAVPAHPAVQGASLTWSPDGMRLLGYSPDQTDVVDIDLSGARPTRVIPVAFDQEARWQRVAP